MLTRPFVSMLLFVSVAASAGELPDPKLTPGVARALSKAAICRTKWGRDHRHVTQAMKDEVFENYRCAGNDDECCTPDAHGRYCEIDHLLSRELGGADDVKNLWSQSYGGPWNATRKDRLENRLHKEVCENRLSLRDARRAILGDWRVAYRHYFWEPK